MKINAGEIRVGMLLEYKNDLWQVLKTQHVKPGKGGAFAQVEMKSVGKNTKLNERFRSSETVEKASLEETDFNYLYDDEANYIFMNPKTFDQIEIKKDIVGEKGKLMTDFSISSPLVIPDPDVTCTKIKPNEDEFIILACDGLWDVLTSQEAVDLVKKDLLQGMSVDNICEHLVNHALQIGSRDNVTAMVVMLDVV